MYRIACVEFFQYIQFGDIIRHPSNVYIQGMNDIVAPIFAVFLADQFHMTFTELETNFPKLEKKFTGFEFLEVNSIGRS